MIDIDPAPPLPAAFAVMADCPARAWAPDGWGFVLFGCWATEFAVCDDIQSPMQRSPAAAVLRAHGGYRKNAKVVQRERNSGCDRSKMFGHQHSFRKTEGSHCGPAFPGSSLSKKKERAAL